MAHRWHARDRRLNPLGNRVDGDLDLPPCGRCDNESAAVVGNERPGKDLAVFGDNDQRLVPLGDLGARIDQRFEQILAIGTLADFRQIGSDEPAAEVAYRVTRIAANLTVGVEEKSSLLGVSRSE